MAVVGAFIFNRLAQMIPLPLFFCSSTLIARILANVRISKRLCPMLNGTMKPEDAGLNGDSSFGARPAALVL